MLLAPTAHIVANSDLSSFSVARVILWIFGSLVIVGALATISQRNDVAAVMSLVATFFGLAAVYTFLSAHFIAVLQVLVYAGAIMVLFIFVVMVLNRDETDPWVWRGVVGKALLGVLPIVYLGGQLVMYLRGVAASHASPPDAEFGTVAQVGELLFTDYLFAFEAVSVLLLIAVIAAVVVARTSKQSTEAHSPTPKPQHQFGDAHTGALYSETAVPTPPGGGHHSS